MKIGNLFITWKTPQQRVQVTSIARRWLEDRNEGRELVARLARSEVKNYLAEIAEEAEMPFVSGAGFLHALLADAVSAYPPEIVYSAGQGVADQP
jgi:hypothetical protein